MMAALGVVFMFAGGFFGVMTYASPLLAAVCLIPVMREFGKGWAWLCWFATAVLSALLTADKEAAFFYIFVGYYPMIRPFFNRIGPKIPRVLVKLAFFTASVAVMYLLLLFVLRLDQVVSDFGNTGRTAWLALNGVLVLILLLYDAGLKVCGAFYEKKLRPRLKFLNK